MDLDKNSFLGSEHQVESIPTFIYTHKGQIVAKKGGADPSSIESTVSWLIKTYNLKPKMINVKKRVKATKGFKIYSVKKKAVYFDSNQNLEFPLQSIVSTAKKSSSLKTRFDDYEETKVILEDYKEYSKMSKEQKGTVLEIFASNMPIENLDALSGILDFFSIIALDSKANQVIATNAGKSLTEILERYFEDNSNNKLNLLRTYFWRFMANFLKHKPGQNWALSNLEALAQGASYTFKFGFNNNTMMRSTSTALCNLLFLNNNALKFGLLIKLSLMKNCLPVLGNRLEETVINTLNILCRVSHGEVTVIEEFNTQNPEYMQQVSIIKNSPNPDVQSFGEDFLKIVNLDFN